jgi:formylglycine-generating enzyme required for sulfatase activity
VRLAATAAFVVAACGDASTPPPDGQILLYIDTDAPLPDAPSGKPPPLFDRLRVALLPPGQSSPCDGCTQDFELTTPLLASLGASVGMAPPVGQTGWTAHVQMFPIEFATTTGDPDPETTVDVTIALPAVTPTGVHALTVTLGTADVGRPVSAAAASVTEGEPAGSLVGTWGPARPVGCTNSPHPGEVCVPGGASWVGTTQTANPPLANTARLPPRIVTLSPFFLDAIETTVASFRQGGGQGALPSTERSGTDIYDWCTFSPSPGPGDDAPVNCLTWSEARAYCQARGADLETEAQWEYVAGALRGSRFVWGSDLPDCDAGVWGRSGYGVFTGDLHACPSATPGSAPAALDASPRALDALELEGGTVYDIAGNLIEWTLDTWDLPDGACWGAARVYADPVCGPQDDAGIHAARGGSWLSNGNELLAVNRYQGTVPDESKGLRCARPDRP